MSHKSEYTMSAQELIQETIRLRALEKQLLKERGELMQRNRELVSDLAGRDTLIAELRDGVWFALECSRDPQNALRLNTLQAHMGDLFARTPKDAGAEVERLRKDVETKTQLWVNEVGLASEARIQLEDIKAQLAEKERKHEDDMSVVIAERDGAEDVITELCKAIGWTPEWSSAYAFDDAIEEAKERVHAMEQRAEARLAETERQRKASELANMGLRAKVEDREARLAAVLEAADELRTRCAKLAGVLGCDEIEAYDAIRAANPSTSPEKINTSAQRVHAVDTTTHYLKTWPAYFSAVESGEKTFEARLDDRGFKVGDTLVLQEWVPLGKQRGYTGRELTRTITYILRSSLHGVAEGHAILALSPATPRPDSVNKGGV